MRQRQPLSTTRQNASKKEPILGKSLKVQFDEILIPQEEASSYSFRDKFLVNWTLRLFPRMVLFLLAFWRVVGEWCLCLIF